MKTRAAIAAIVSVLVASSCQKEGDIFLNTNDPTAANYSTYTGQFNVIWSAINSGYCFWDITDVDWDQRYSEMKPKFEMLDRVYANSGTSVDSTTFSKLYGELVSGLKDHHMMLSVKDPHKDALTIMVIPSKEEVESRSYFHNGKIIDLISSVKYSYGADFVPGGFLLPNGLQSIAIATRIHTGDGRTIPYLWNSSFVNYDDVVKYVEENKNSGDPAIMNIVKNARTWLHVYDVYITWVTETPKDSLAGAILDIRCNLGGDSAGLSQHIGLFTGENKAYFEMRYKEGMGRYEMSAWTPAKINSYRKHRDMAAENIPVIALADIGSMSCAEIAAFSIQSLPTGCFVGERTYGAHGPLLEIEQYSITYGGSTGDRELSTIKHYIYTSTFECRPVGKHCLEGVGVSPDIEVLYNEKGYQGQLQTAIDVINDWDGTFKH